MPELITSSPETKARTNIGQGVSRREIPEEVPLAVEPEIKAEEDSTGKPKWFATPTFEDQWVRYPTTCKPGPIQFKTYSLPEETTELNEFMQKTVPPSAPQIRLVSSEKQAFEGAWSMLVVYHEILYKKLLDPNR